MARNSLICLMILGTFLVPCAVGLKAVPNQIGSINIFNGGTEDFDFFKWVIFTNNTRENDPYSTVLPKSTTYQFEVMGDMMNIFSKYHLAKSTGIYDQTLLSWPTEVNTPISYDPDCFWVVDESGFSVAPSSHDQLRFVTGWNGPHLSSKVITSDRLRFGTG